MSGSADEVLATLRHEKSPRLAFRGFGPLVAAVILLVTMMLLLPSVAPEEEGDRPVTDAPSAERSE